MDLAPYVEELRHHLIVAAEAGGAEARDLADRLTPALESATRLVLLDALSAAANEITSELAPGSVDVRLRGRDPEFVVALPEHHDDVGMTSPGPRTPPPVEDDDGGGTARVTLRLAEQLKARIEEAAALEGVSVNAWLVRSLSASLGAGSTSGTASRTTRPAPSSGQRYSGWAR